MIRENGFYWADVNGVREVCQWQAGTWYLCGLSFSDDDDSAECVKNINESGIIE